MYIDSFFTLNYVEVIRVYLKLNFVLCLLFSFESRGMVFGLWSACASVGNIVGALEVAAVLNYGYEVGNLHYYFLIKEP